jgi:broad-specificity NMP kinase
MQLIFIYGDPGTGKLTVARELQKLTGLKLFHNHLTVDLASSLFGYDNPDYFDYVRSLRLEAFERAAKANMSLIFTFWYSSISQPSVEKYQHTVESRGGKVLFVRLHCRPEVLEERVVSESRQNWKISSVADLRAALENTGDVIPGTHLEVENSELSPEVVAEMIATKLELQRSYTRT